MGAPQVRSTWQAVSVVAGRACERSCARAAVRPAVRSCHLNVRKLDLTDANVFVRTDRSPDGKPVSIEAVQNSLERLPETGEHP
jgi:hypothetical protein